MLSTLRELLEHTIKGRSAKPKNIFPALPTAWRGAAAKVGVSIYHSAPHYNDRFESILL